MTKAMYVHVPFCQHICAYCDFMRCGYEETLGDKWLDAMAKELQEKQPMPCDTMYIGGGTPSALSLAQLERLLSLLAPYASNVKEYTIEVNADSLSLDKISCLKQYGINRISMGAQSFQPHLLQRIERIADYEMIATRIQELRDHGITNISLDLMYGLPEQTMADWKADLDKAINLPITHLSLYALTIEEHSKFGREHVEPCEEEMEADFYEMAMRKLQHAGFEHYEISSFARAGQYSKHNLAYWHYDDFYGIGCGASGKESHVRYDNTRNLHTYVTKGPSPTKIDLTKQDEMFEMIMMGLRIKEGVAQARFQTCFGCSIVDVFPEAINKHIALGNLIQENGYLHTSDHGMMILHDILVDFL